MEIDESGGERTLMTEHNRGHLRGTFGVVPVEQVLILRFPVVRGNPRIVAFCYIAEFAVRFNSVLMTSEVESTHV
ncbi:hypothetical protein FQZ97_943030 [compost metagenome]